MALSCFFMSIHTTLSHTNLPSKHPETAFSGTEAAFSGIKTAILPLEASATFVSFSFIVLSHYHFQGSQSMFSPIPNTTHTSARNPPKHKHHTKPQSEKPPSSCHKKPSRLSKKLLITRERCDTTSKKPRVPKRNDDKKQLRTR